MRLAFSGPSVFPPPSFYRPATCCDAKPWTRYSSRAPAIITVRRDSMLITLSHPSANLNSFKHQITAFSTCRSQLSSPLSCSALLSSPHLRCLNHARIAWDRIVLVLLMRGGLVVVVLQRLMDRYVFIHFICSLRRGHDESDHQWAVLAKYEAGTDLDCADNDVSVGLLSFLVARRWMGRKRCEYSLSVLDFLVLTSSGRLDFVLLESNLEDTD